MKTVICVPMTEWDDLVETTYGRTYRVQQQDGGKDRGTIRLKVPRELEDYDYENDSVPEIVNGDDMGVSFAAWLARSPTQKLNHPDYPNQGEDYCLDLWWQRNFYPALEVVANDLHAKGLLKRGEYTILLEW